jgi:hypothetical protein
MAAGFSGISLIENGNLEEYAEQRDRDMLEP